MKLLYQVVDFEEVTVDMKEEIRNMAKSKKISEVVEYLEKHPKIRFNDQQVYRYFRSLNYYYRLQIAIIL